jgi:hypothetical protein
MTTVIFVMKTDYRNTLGCWGLGDMIRGLKNTFIVCTELKYTLYVDFSNHPVRHFLKQKKHPFKEYVKNNVENVPFFPHTCDLKCEILQLTQNGEGPILLGTNCSLREKDEILLEDVKTFLKENLFDFSEEFIEFANTNEPRLKYNILHFRLDDNFDNFHRECNQENILCQMLEKIKVHVEDNDVFISNSIVLKNIVNENKISCITYNYDICHLGSVSSSRESIRNTLFELFMITRAVQIKTFSTYPWVSGFVFWASNIFNVKLEIIL